MNNKGFTLVELIAMMVVIGVLMTITIPNISGILKKNRESIGVEDINKMVGNAQTKLESGKLVKPEKGQCIVLTLSFIDANSDFQTGINGGEYARENSIVVVTKESVDPDNPSSSTTTYKYYIGLLEVKGGKSYFTQNSSGQPALIDYDIFSKNPEENIPKIAPNASSVYDIITTASESTLKTQINNYIGSTKCNTILKVYNK